MCSLENISKFYIDWHQNSVGENEWELIFVDELKVDTGEHVHIGWARREKKTTQNKSRWNNINHNCYIFNTTNVWNDDQ